MLDGLSVDTLRSGRIAAARSTGKAARASMAHVGRAGRGTFECDIVRQYLDGLQDYKLPVHS